MPNSPRQKVLALALLFLIFFGLFTLSLWEDTVEVIMLIQLLLCVISQGPVCGRNTKNFSLQCCRLPFWVEHLKSFTGLKYRFPPCQMEIFANVSIKGRRKKILALSVIFCDINNKMAKARWKWLHLKSPYVLFCNEKRSRHPGCSPQVGKGNWLRPED